MDDDYVRAVMTFFVRLWDRGWIYRANRIVNWCPFHQTAISDLEVVHEEMDDTLYTIRYPFADGDGREGVSIATVRPATILADVAVAVHPDDPRYRDAIGREVVVPYIERRVPVIADERIDREFGTGALKVTPGHDPLDFEIGRDHGLPEPMAVGWDGLMSEVAGDLAGLTQEEAGARVIAWAEERGLVEKREPYRHSVGTCERCHSRIEPLISLQWWCAMAEPAAPAIAALRERRVRFHPESQHRFAITSLEETPDWCISRQLWWGHQLPIWYCPDGHTTVTESTSRRACAECGSGELERESDVLDTWFSSALWPFATLGWPDETPELARYYPGNVNSTAREIIRLWENRMIWTGLEALGEVPFTDVIIHSTVLALDGRRMSKSLGTGIDPMRADRGVRRRCDPLRAAEDLLDAGRALLVRGDRGGAQARDQALERRAPDPAERRGRDRVGRAARASRSAGSSRDSTPRAPSSRTRGRASTSPSRPRRSTTSRSTTSATGTRRRSSRGSTTRDETAISTALAALERLLALLHPVMPHVTEEIWSQLPGERGALDRLSVAGARRRRSPTMSARSIACRRPRRSSAEAACRSSSARTTSAASSRPSCARRRRASTTTAMPRSTACARRSREARAMLANERFVSNAPAEVVDAEREKLERYRRELAALEGS